MLKGFEMTHTKFSDAQTENWIEIEHKKFSDAQTENWMFTSQNRWEKCAANEDFIIRIGQPAGDQVYNLADAAFKAGDDIKIFGRTFTAIGLLRGVGVESELVLVSAETTKVMDHSNIGLQRVKTDHEIHRAKTRAANRTLEFLGYTYHGGEQYKPPLGNPPAFKCKYEKIDTSKVKLWELMQAEEEESVCFYDSVKNEVGGAALVEVYNNNTLYRKVAVTWQDALKEFVCTGCTFIKSHSEIGAAWIDGELEGDAAWDKEFIKMCHLVASMTCKPK